MARSGPSKGRLQFNQQLTGVPSGEQLKRLHDLHIELGKLDQDTVDTKSLDKIKDKLINPGLLLGKDKGVKAYTCCCLADLLRLYAPDCPYEDKDLKDIFQFFIRQLKYLTGPSCPNYTQYFYLLESLSNVKSATLMPSLPGAEQLMTEMAKQAFDLAKPDMPKNLIAYIADILVQIIDDAPILPSELVDVLLAQYLPKNVKANPTALSLAVEVCKETTEKLQRYIAEYFTEVLLVSPEDEDEEMDSEPEASSKKGKKGKAVATSKADDSEFILTHDLIKSIARVCPDLLANVIPLVEAELVSEDLGVRILASRILGEMFSDKPLERAGSLPLLFSSTSNNNLIIQTTRADLAKKHPQTWKAWLQRSRDKAHQVRLTIIESAKEILPNHHELGRDIYEIWKGRFTDPDDRIRAVACAAFSTVDYESSLHAFDKETLVSLAARIQDRKPAVQKEALNSLGRMYNNAFGEISNGEQSAIDRFCWIPSEILRCSLLSDKHLHASTERVLHEYILPLPPRPEEESFYVDRLLLVMHYLDTPGRKALLRAARLFEKRPLVYETYLDICEKYNGGNPESGLDEDEISQQLQIVCRLLAPSFPDTPKAEADLHKFAKLNDHRTMKLLRSLMDSESEGRTVVKNVEESLKRIEKASSAILETFSIFIRRSGFLLINRTTIPYLLERLSRAAELPGKQLPRNGSEDEDEDAQMDEQADEQVQEFGELARTILEAIIKHCPVLLKAHVPHLCKLVQESKVDSIVTLALHGLSSVTRSDPQAFVRDSEVLDKAFELAMEGSPVTAKYAATFLAVVPDNNDQCEELVKNLADALPVSSGIQLNSHLNALKRLAKYAIDAFETRAREITTFTTGELKKPTLHSTPSRASNTSMDIDIKPFNGGFDDWCEDEDFLPEHAACLIGLKVLANRVYALGAKEDAVKIEGVVPIFKLLGFILTKSGKPANFKTGPGLAGRLRLEAATSLLMLGTKECYHRIFMEHFEQFCWTIQDPAFQVRSGLIHKFIKYASSGRITNPKMFTALFLTAHDPDVENRLMPQKYITERMRVMKPEIRLQIEVLLVRLIHLLAHHPDFSTDVEDLKTFSRYLEFFLDCVATKENVSLLYYLSLKVKTVRDARSSEFDSYLYTLAELAQHVIKSRTTLMGWTLDKYPGAIRMPSDIFKALSSPEEAHEIRNKAYISSKAIEELGTVGKPVDLPKKPRQTKKATINGQSTSKAKGHARKTSTSSIDTNATMKKPRSKAKPSSTKVHGAKKENGDANGSMSRKRKKGLKEWEDDTEDEEEDADESDEVDVEDEESAATENDSANVSKGTDTEKESKARPSNLRQRPQRTAKDVAPSNPAKPISKNKKSRSKGGQQEEAEEEATEKEGKEDSGELTSIADDSSSKENQEMEKDANEMKDEQSPKRQRTTRNGKTGKSNTTSPEKEIRASPVKDKDERDGAKEPASKLEQVQEKEGTKSPGKLRRKPRTRANGVK